MRLFLNVMILVFLAGCNRNDQIKLKNVKFINSSQADIAILDDWIERYRARSHIFGLLVNEVESHAETVKFMITKSSDIYLIGAPHEALVPDNQIIVLDIDDISKYPDAVPKIDERNWITPRAAVLAHEINEGFYYLRNFKTSNQYDKVLTDAHKSGIDIENFVASELDRKGARKRDCRIDDKVHIIIDGNTEQLIIENQNIKDIKYFFKSVLCNP